MELSLSSLNDFYGLFAALNLGYAGFKRFQSAIDNDILRIIPSNHSKLTKLQEDVKSLKTVSETGGLDQRLLEKIETLFKNRENAEDLIKRRSKESADISDGFKAIFLYTSFYCLVLLVSGAYQELYGDKRFNEFLHFINGSLFFQVFIFSRSFTRFKLVKIKPILTIAIVITPLLCFQLYVLLDGYFFQQFYLNIAILTIRDSISLTVFIAAAPYFFYFLRLYITRQYFAPKLSKINKTCIDKVGKIKDIMQDDFIKP